MRQSDNSVTPTFTERHTAALRIWHWCTFLVITASLVTILLKSTILHPQNTVPALQSELMNRGITVPAQKMRGIMRPINRGLWEWHTYFGYVLSGLFLFRILLGFFQPTGQKLFQRIKSMLRYLKMPGADRAAGRHYLLVKIIYGLFYLALSVTVATGLCLAFADDVEFLGNAEHTIKEIHNFNMYVILTYIAVHLAGVIRAELTKHRGVVSGMINGGE